MRLPRTPRCLSALKALSSAPTRSTLLCDMSSTVRLPDTGSRPAVDVSSLWERSRCERNDSCFSPVILVRRLCDRSRWVRYLVGGEQ